VVGGRVKHPPRHPPTIEVALVLGIKKTNPSAVAIPPRPVSCHFLRDFAVGNTLGQIS
jgi:hypothetical protein